MKRVIVFGCVFLALCFALFVVNQTAQVVSLANTVSPAFGRAVLVALLAIYFFAVLLPVVLLVRLPKPMIPPADEHSAEYQAYLRRLGARLATNRVVAATGPIEDRAAIESALTALDAKAEDIIRSSAAAVFISTAISQNGRLDALMVLIEQSRLIWRLAHVYDQRPSVRDFVRLYANVGATLFAASGLEDIDIYQQVEPVINTALGGAVVSAVPGFAPVAGLVINSIFDGTANAYLTLRVGIICRDYCGGLTAVDRRGIRKHASIAAAAMLGSIVGASAGAVVKAILESARKAGVASIGSAVGRVRGAGAKLNPFRPRPTLDSGVFPPDSPVT